MGFGCSQARAFSTLRSTGGASGASPARLQKLHRLARGQLLVFQNQYVHTRVLKE